MVDPAGQEEVATSTGAPPEGVRAVRIPRDLDVAAAARLVGDGAGPRQQAARRMVTAAALHGIDLSLMWGTLEKSDDRATRVRQVCLAVPGAGKTAMLVISGPEGSSAPAVEHTERVASIRAACDHFREQTRRGGRPVCLAQALLEPHEVWAVEALRSDGFIKVGDLAYLRARLRGTVASAAGTGEPTLPPGVTLRTVRDLTPGGGDRRDLLLALDRSYQDTLDCPELCGLRETVDVLESHRATGQWDPKLWWVVLHDGQPHGCMLLSRFPEQDSVELVYLGLSPSLRGQRIGSKLLEMGMRRAAATGADHMTCAVDLRNEPALRLYERSGFREFGRRIAMVKPL